MATTTPVKSEAGIVLALLASGQFVMTLDKAGASGSDADAIMQVNADARLDALRNAFGVTPLLTTGALFFTGRLPRRAPGSDGHGDGDDDDDESEGEPVDEPRQV